jgi:hypothetical protein
MIEKLFNDERDGFLYLQGCQFKHWQNEKILNLAVL